MAAFTVSLDDDVSPQAIPAAKAVSSLSDEFDRLQKTMAGMGGWSGIQEEQKRNLAYHDSLIKKGASEKDILAQVAEEQKKALAGHDADRDAALGRERAQLAAIAEEQKKAFELHDAIAQRQKITEETAKTAKWFEDLSQNSSAFQENMAGAKYQLIEAFNWVAPIAEGIALWGAALSAAMGYAIRLTQQKDAIRSTFDVFTGGSGQKLLDDLEDLAATLPFTADKLNDWAKGLLAAGIKGEALRQSIRAIASATAIMGESGGAAAEGLIKRFAMMAETGQKVTLDRRILNQLAEAGVSVNALAKALGVAPDKLGKMSLNAKDLGAAMQKALIQQGVGPLAKLGQTGPAILAKIKEGFEDAFEDLGELVGPFMKEVQSFASEFFAGSVAANDFKGVVKAGLTVAFEVARNFVNFLHRGFLNLQIAILTVRVALKPLTSVLGEIGVGAGLVNVALYVLKGTVIVVSVVFGILALAVALVAVPFVLVGVAIYVVIRAIGALVGLIQGAVANFDNLKNAATQAGTDLIQGLGNAILSGQAWVIGLITGLAQSMIGAIKVTLGIKSPSRVMHQLGDYTVQGLGDGIAAGSDDVARAAQGAGDAAVAGAAKGASTGAQGAATGGTVFHFNFETGSITVHGGAEEVSEATIMLAFERMALQRGVAR